MTSRAVEAFCSGWAKQTHVRRRPADASANFGSDGTIHQRVFEPRVAVLFWHGCLHTLRRYYLGI